MLTILKLLMCGLTSATTHILRLLVILQTYTQNT